MEINVLRRCPFCGDEARVGDITVKKRFRKPFTVFFVECKNCKARTSLELVIEDAQYKWNKRVE